LKVIYYDKSRLAIHATRMKIPLETDLSRVCGMLCSKLSAGNNGECRQMNIKTYVIHRHVKGQDLNHHGTLFAGRGAEWLWKPASLRSQPDVAGKGRLYEYSRHGFLKGCSAGHILRFESKVVFAGRSRLVTYVNIVFGHNDEQVLDGFLTFVYVGRDGVPCRMASSSMPLIRKTSCFRRRRNPCHSAHSLRTICFSRGRAGKELNR